MNAGRIGSWIRWGGILMVRTLLRYDPICGCRLERRHAVRVGRGDGCWWVPAAVREEGLQVISAGVGEETSFEEDLLDHWHASVTALDPTPRALRHSGPIAARHPGFQMLAMGLWDQDGEQVFHAPQNPDHVSHSLVALQGEAPGFTAPCLRLATLLDREGLPVPDLLKLDIEGAEIRVVQDLLDSQRFPRVLCLEFDEVQTPLDNGWRERIRETVRHLHTHGYRLLRIHHKANATFVRHAN